MPVQTISPRQAQWRQVKGRIIAAFGSIKACAEQIGCSPASLRVSIISDLLPGVRRDLFAQLDRREKRAA